MEAPTVKSLTGPTVRLVIEDPKGGQSFFHQSLDERNKEYLLVLREHDDVCRLEEGWSGKEAPSPDASGYPAKIRLAENVFRNLNQWHEWLFEKEPFSSVKDFLERQVFFNSNLIYFIAATETSEDNLGHSQNVAAYTILLAEAIGIEDRNVLIDLERGALLHDIGKIGVPRSILRKQGPLTRLEKEIVKDHPLLGYRLVRGFSFLERASRIILCHHERFDGSGYPFNMAGEDIPIEARIFAVADTLDAITSSRPYRNSRRFEEAIREIEKSAGSQFDPVVIEAFKGIPEERWFQTKLETIKSLRLPSSH